MPCKKCYLFSIVLAFLCGRAKMIRIRYVYAYLFEGKRREKKSSFSKLSGYVRTFDPAAYRYRS